ncbi:MAG: RluA family pseudouridine synthase [Desulfovibrionaceae bacterium]
MKIPVQTFTVTAEEAGQKLLQYLARRLGRDVPPAALQRFIRTGQVRVDGKRAKPFNRLAMGQLVRVPPYEPGGPGPGTPRPPGASPPETVPALDILHEDADLLVLVKPAGLPVHPGSGHATALTTILHARDPGAPFKPTPAHRLDRDTTGILLVAKSYRALRGIHAAMDAGEMDKDYLTWVQGRWMLGEVNEWVTLRDRLAKEGEPGRERMAAGEAGKEAVAKVRLLFTTGEASLLEVRLETGRTHQIRTQLGSRGHPVIGDAKYGGGRPPLFLHAWRIVLPGAAFCVPPPWPAPWAVAKPRRIAIAPDLDWSLLPGQE